MSQPTKRETTKEKVVGFFIEDEEESEDQDESCDDVMNFKRGSVGQPLPKNTRSKSTPPTKIKDILNKGP